MFLLLYFRGQPRQTQMDRIDGGAGLPGLGDDLFLHTKGTCGRVGRYRSVRSVGLSRLAADSGQAGPCKKGRHEIGFLMDG